MAFDPRTGEQAWTVPSPTPCGYVRVADTATTLVGIEQCIADDERTSTFRVVSLDPADGRVRFAKDILTRRDVSLNTRAGPAGAHGSMVHLLWGTADRSTGVYQSPTAHLYVDGDTGAVTDFGLAQIETSSWPVGDFIVVTSVGRGAERDLHGGTQTCRLPDGFPFGGSWRQGEADVAWLGSQLVARSSDGGTALDVVDRATCRPVMTTPQGDGIALQMVAAPGVLAVLVIDRNVLFLDGYAP